MAKLYTFFHCNHGRIITSSTQYNRQSFDVFLNYIYYYITVSFILVFVHGRTVWIPAFLTGYHRNSGGGGVTWHTPLKAHSWVTKAQKSFVQVNIQ